MARSLTEFERKHIAEMYSRCGFPIPAHLLPDTRTATTGARYEKKEADQDVAAW